jgi:hypothetical protein
MTSLEKKRVLEEITDKHKQQQHHAPTPNDTANRDL